MNRPMKWGLLGAGYLVTSFALGADGAASAANGPPVDQVSVVNTPTVNVGTMPTVSIAGSVGITGVPSVAIASFPGGPLNVTGTVGLAAGTTVTADPSETVGTSASPASGEYAGSNVGGKTALVVKNADVGQRPFSEFCQIQLPVGQSSATASTTDVVPAGKRAVIEYASASCSVANGQLTGIEIAGNTPSWSQPSFQFVHMLMPNLVAANVQGFQNQYSASQPVRAYLEPGTALQCAMSVDIPTPGSSGTAAECVFDVTGYLVDTP